MPLRRREALEAAATGLAGGYALTKLLPSVWSLPAVVRRRYPIRVHNGTDDPYEVSIRAFRGGPGGEVLTFHREVTVESTAADGSIGRRTVGELVGTHRIVVEYGDGTVVERFTEGSDCEVIVYHPTDTDLPEPVVVACAV